MSEFPVAPPLGFAGTDATIAHRLSTLRHADKIIVIKDGVVAEDGSHEGLLAVEGVYAQLYRMQYRKPVA